MPPRIVGIDLGTTNSLVAYMNGDRPEIIPAEYPLADVCRIVYPDLKSHIIGLLPLYRSTTKVWP